MGISVTMKYIVGAHAILLDATVKTSLLLGNIIVVLTVAYNIWCGYRQCIPGNPNPYC